MPPKTSTQPCLSIAAPVTWGKSDLLAAKNRSIWSTTLSFWSLRVYWSSFPFHDSSWPLPAPAFCATLSNGPRSDSLVAIWGYSISVKPALSECWGQCFGRGLTPAIAAKPDFVSQSFVQLPELGKYRVIHRLRLVCAPWANLSTHGISLHFPSQLQSVDHWDLGTPV